MPPISLWRLEASGPIAPLERAYGLLESAEPPLTLALSIFEDGPRRRRLEMLFDHAPDFAAVREAAGLTPEDAEITGGPLDDQDWVALSLEGLPPVDAGRFRLRGAHDRPRAGGAVDLLIEAGQAFGTGHHGTTKGCLLALDRVLRRWAPRSILDVGSGTGALAIAAAKATKAPALATDIDPVAVEVARENVAVNGAAGLVRVIEADGFAHEALRGALFDVVLANILAGPLILMAKDLTGAVAPGGRLILSGLLTTQARAVEAAYRARGLLRDHRLILGDWATLTLIKP